MILKNFQVLKTYLETPRNIVIIGHRNPDGDAVGSTLGLQFYLKKKNHKVTVLMPNQFPEFLNWLPKADKILCFDHQNKQSIEALEGSDIVFLLDFNTLHRVGSDMQNTLEKYKHPFALIDHHQQPDDFEYMYSDTTISSTCQMVYHFIEMMGNLELIDKMIATCLYTGIMTDTGSFRFRSTTSTTHRIVADLIDKGAENDRIHSNVYDANSYSRLQLLGTALNNLHLLSEYKTAYITLTQDEKNAFACQKGDTEGFVNYALSLKGVVLAAIFIEDQEQGIIKMSLRSKGHFSVNEMARKHFEGGGHTNAAGGKSTVSMEKTVEAFIALLPKYQDKIRQSYEA